MAIILFAPFATNAAATNAKFSGQVAGMTTDVTITANVAGSVGNITLTANKVTDVEDLIANWNDDNSSNALTLTAGDGTQIPTANIVLTGGNNANNANPVPVTPIKPGVASTVYNLLAPIGNLVCIDTNTANPAKGCASGGIGDYLNIIFKLAIGLCAALAVVMIIINAVKYMGHESVFGKTEAIGNIWNCVLGLFIALGAYALLNTINPDLLGSKGVTVSNVTINVDPDAPQPIPSDGQPYPGTTYKKGDAFPSPAVPATDNTSDFWIRSYLNGLGISVTKAACVNVGDYDCTSLYNLNYKYVYALKQACSNCELNITGGTEFWRHGLNSVKSHYPGGWVVDLAKTSTLTAYVHGLTKLNLPKWGNGGADCYYGSGLGFVEEFDHFHAMNSLCNINNQGSM